MRSCCRSYTTMYECLRHQYLILLAVAAVSRGMYCSSALKMAHSSPGGSTVASSGGVGSPGRSNSALEHSRVDAEAPPVDAERSLDSAAKEIVDGFKPRAYQAPWWARNAHVSTIIGSGEVQRKVFGRLGPQIKYRRERWDTPDGDFIDVDFLDSPGGERGVAGEGGAYGDDSAPFAVLTHGLESTSDAPLTARMALAYQREGFRVAVMCFRGCSGEDSRTLRAYHLGFTEDLELVCKTLRARHPKSQLFVSGFSLGGNVVTKFLGELGDRAQELGIMGGAVTCVPFHAVSAQKRIDTGFGKRVYAKNFLGSLIPKILRMSKTNPEVAKVIDLEKLQRITTIGEFDDLVVAPVFGFDDFQDYYRKSQAGQYLKGVRVPLLAIQAIDDPFMDPAELPTVDDLKGAPVMLSYHQHGGHCAFVVTDKEENDKGWLATELSRFGRHVQEMSVALPDGS